MSSETSGSSPRKLYPRDGVEFNRVLAFSDGVFAIAITLLVISIEVPDLADKDSVGDLADALNDLYPAIVSFVISFLVIGRYWIAHHTFVASLKGIDGAFIWANLIYLGFVAFLPFPTALLGELFENPLSIAVYAVAAGAVSAMEVVLMRRAHRDGLMDPPLSDEAMKWGSLAALTPVLFFALSIPIAFLAGTTLAALSWLLTIPAAMALDRRRPAEVRGELERIG